MAVVRVHLSIDPGEAGVNASLRPVVESLGGTIEEFAVAHGLEHADYYMEIGRDYVRDALALWKSMEPQESRPAGSGISTA